MIYASICLDKYVLYMHELFTGESDVGLSPVDLEFGAIPVSVVMSRAE